MDVERLVLATLFTGLLACGGGSKVTSAPKSEPVAEGPDGGAVGADGSGPGRGDAGPPEKPFAGSAGEATELITQAVDQKQDAVAHCVQEYRFRKHLAHEKVSINIGIDQEGRLIGVTLPKGKEDKELSACVRQELRDAPFPRSHSGVITITRTFQEMVK